MTEALATLFAISEDWLWRAALVFLRVGAMMAVLPALGGQRVPVQVKLAVSVALTMVITPLVADALPAGTFDLSALALYLASETVVGLALGLGVRMLVLGLQTAGSIAAQATSLSQILGGAGAEPLPAMGHVLVIGGLALAMITGYHLHVVSALAKTYQVMPAGRFPAPVALSQWGVAQVAAAFSLAFTLAAPFVVISTLYNLMLGVINRAMPQLMVAFVGAPLITAGGLALLFVMAPLMLSLWVAALQRFLDAPGLGAG